MAKLEGLQDILTDEELSKIGGYICSPEDEDEPQGIMKRIKKKIQKVLK